MNSMAHLIQFGGVHHVKAIEKRINTIPSVVQLEVT
jgi:hypothetical protein